VTLLELLTVAIVGLAPKTLPYDDAVRYATDIAEVSGDGEGWRAMKIVNTHGSPTVMEVRGADMKVAEFLAFGRTLSDEEQARVELYLSRKYGLPSEQLEAVVAAYDAMLPWWKVARRKVVAAWMNWR
jgi:hypothetical protein